MPKKSSKKKLVRRASLPVSIKKKAPTIVSREFLNNLADTIFNRNQCTFLRLCHGTLQNGPDPKDSKRSMHCGLGELYFAMTGNQPSEGRITSYGERRKVTEQDVVHLAVKNSTLVMENKASILVAQEIIKKLPKFISEHVACNSNIGSLDPAEDPRVEQFSELLDSIADVNDSVEGSSKVGWDDDVCETESNATYRARASKVATILRKAAKLLPA